MFENYSDGPFGGQSPFGGPQPDQVPESQQILLGLLSELPDEARTLVDKIDKELTRSREQLAVETDAIREEANRKIASLEEKADERERTLFRHAMEQLEPLQRNLFRAGDLAAALATFVQIQALKAKLNAVLPDPGNLFRFQIVGKSFCFRVIGQVGGPVWGTDVYTADSHLATAAVHAGVVELGEEGIVKATLVTMAGQPIYGSMRNGVMSHNWPHYEVGYRLSRSGE
jgi:hypothetical protein